MPDELLTIFKLCFLVLLYLFFFRVLRAVWSEVNAPAGASGAPAGKLSTPGAPPKVSKRVKAPKTAPAVAPSVPAASAPPPEARPTKLVAVDPPQLVGIEYALVDGMTIGRGDAASIVIDDSFLSQRHAAFEVRDGAWVVADLNSTNGTYLNRTKVTQIARINLGDRVEVGNVVLEVG